MSDSTTRTADAPGPSDDGAARSRGRALVVRLPSAGLEVCTLVAAFAVAVVGGWLRLARPHDVATQAVPLATALPTPLSDRFTYFTAYPTAAPTAAGPARRLRVAGLAGGMPHEVLAALPDPNTTDPRYAVVALDAITRTTGGPRLALSGGGRGGTLDLGEVVADRPLTVPLVLANAGDRPLVLSRVYSASPALTVAIAGAAIDPAGGVSGDASIPPGAQRALTLVLDPAAVLRPGERPAADAVAATAAYLQLFSNDGDAPRLDDADAASGERRLRVVYTPRDAASPGHPVDAAEEPVADGVPRFWLAEGARWGRGGRIVDIGPVNGEAPGDAVATIRNLGSAPLELSFTDRVATTKQRPATLEAATVPPNGETRLHVMLPAAEEDDALR
ncbi:MAG: hypothetical protein ABI780_07015, partial [Ardenticatenales bacterium]